MSTIESDVTAPVSAMGEALKGIAAKNATMRDGPPESSGEGTGTTTRERNPAPEDKSSALQRFRDRTDASFDRFFGDDGQLKDGKGLAAEIFFNAFDFVGDIGPSAVKAFTDLAKVLKK